MAIKVVIPPTFYKSLIWCYLLFNNSHQCPILHRKRSFLWYITPELSSLDPRFSLIPCPTTFSSTQFCFSPRELLYEVGNILLFLNSRCFLTSILLHMLFLLYGTFSPSSLLGNSILFLLEDFIQISPLNMPPHSRAPRHSLSQPYVKTNFITSCGKMIIIYFSFLRSYIRQLVGI